MADTMTKLMEEHLIFAFTSKGGFSPDEAKRMAAEFFEDMESIRTMPKEERAKILNQIGFTETPDGRLILPRFKTQ